MIIVNLDVMMAKRKMSLNELSKLVGITTANLSILKTGKAKAIRFLLLTQYAVLLIVSLATFWNIAIIMRNNYDQSYIIHCLFLLALMS